MFNDWIPQSQPHKTGLRLAYPTAPTQSTLPSLFDLGALPLKSCSRSAFRTKSQAAEDMPTPVYGHPSCRKSSRECGKQGLRDINVIRGTPLARIDYSSLDCPAGSGVVNTDMRPTLGIGVWVGAIGHL